MVAPTTRTVKFVLILAPKTSFSGPPKITKAYLLYVVCTTCLFNVDVKLIRNNVSLSVLISPINSVTSYQFIIELVPINY